MDGENIEWASNYENCGSVFNEEMCHILIHENPTKFIVKKNGERGNTRGKMRICIENGVDKTNYITVKP